MPPNSFRPEGADSQRVRTVANRIIETLWCRRGSER